MRYINALELINLCIKNDILKEIDRKVLLYRSGTPNKEEGLYLTDKDIAAKELMNNEKGQKILISKLKEKNIEFIPTEYF